MADKKITDLTLRSNVNDDVNFPVDDGIQTYRVTAPQVAAYVKTTNRIPGEIKSFAMATAPAGFLECDGSAVSRSTYAALFAAIGETFGEGNNTTTFNLPDLRGAFLRGWDHGAGNDPDAAGRTAQATGGNTGDTVGSEQADDFKSHSHNVNKTSTPWSAAGVSVSNIAYDTLYQDVATSDTGGNETRPRNVNIMYGIAY